MTRYEYEFIPQYLYSPQMWEECQVLIREKAEEGWRLVQILPLYDRDENRRDRLAPYQLILERERQGV